MSHGDVPNLLSSQTPANTKTRIVDGELDADPGEFHPGHGSGGASACPGSASFRALWRVPLVIHSDAEFRSL